MVNEWVVIADGISPGFAAPDFAFDVFGNLGISQLAGINNSCLSFDDFQIIIAARPSWPCLHGLEARATFANNGKASDYLVGFTKELSCNLFGVFRVTGFADNLALEIDDGIGAYDD